MKRTKFTEGQIIKILAAQENGRSVSDISREYGISPGTFYNWKGKYGGMDANQLRKLKELKSELVKYKKMYAELAHQNYVIKDVIEKKL